MAGPGPANAGGTAGPGPANAGGTAGPGPANKLLCAKPAADNTKVRTSKRIAIFIKILFPPIFASSELRKIADKSTGEFVLRHNNYKQWPFPYLQVFNSKTNQEFCTVDLCDENILLKNINSIT
jgi:hypothetical protein